MGHVMVFGKRSATEEEVERALNMEIVITRREQYGTERFYPECVKAALLARLAHRRTFTRTELSLIKELGYKIVIKQEEVVI